MSYTLHRILKHGLMAAVALAVIGYLMAEVAGVWVMSQPTARPGATPVQVGNELKYRLPFTLAGWGFGLILVYELVLHVLRGGKPPAPPSPTPAPSDADVETLLVQLMQQAEAAEEVRKQALIETPAPVACLTPAPADNTPVPNRG